VLRAASPSRGHSFSWSPVSDWPVTYLALREGALRPQGSTTCTATWAEEGEQRRTRAARRVVHRLFQVYEDKALTTTINTTTTDLTTTTRLRLRLTRPQQHDHDDLDNFDERHPQHRPIASMWTPGSVIGKFMVTMGSSMWMIATCSMKPEVTSCSTSLVAATMAGKVGWTFQQDVVVVD
jgi:hypothetical protein